MSSAAQKSYVPFSRNSSFCIFNPPMIYQICDVMMSISTWNRVHFWMYILNCTLSHQTWPLDKYKHGPGLFSTTCCVWYPHTVPFRRNEMPYSKNTHRLGECKVVTKFGKTRGENPQLCPFSGFSCPFLVIPHACPYFLE